MARLAARLLLASAVISSVSASGTLLWNIEKNVANEDAQLKTRSLGLRRRGLDIRDDTVTAELGNALQSGLYYANISIGTPPQDLGVQIDTGSADLWAPSSDAPLCRSQGDRCSGGSFDSRASSTFEEVGPGDFDISYADNTGAQGDYFQDTFSLGDTSIRSFQMGLAINTTIGIGIMGIGYNTSEANVGTGNGTIYPNLPYALADAGLISSNAYSLWLNDLRAQSGSILFGGVDTARYTGDLTSVKVYPTGRGGITSFTVALTSLSATSSSGSDQLTPPDYAEPAILDSGTTITLLPNNIAQTVFEELGATVSSELGATVVPCRLASNPGTLNYGFGGSDGPTIKVSMSQLVLPLTLTNGRSPTYPNGEPACQLGIMAAGNLPVLLGDTFLRSAYAVYDLANNRVALAQTNFDATEAHVVPFASSGAPIPSATMASGLEQVTQTLSGIPRGGGSSTAAGSGQPTYNPTATGLSAASGFTATGAAATQTQTGESASAPGPEPFRWAPVAVLTWTVGALVVGMGGFAML